MRRILAIDKKDGIILNIYHGMVVNSCCSDRDLVVNHILHGEIYTVNDKIVKIINGYLRIDGVVAEEDYLGDIPNYDLAEIVKDIGEDADSVEEYLDFLKQKYPALSEIFTNLKFSVNDDLIKNINKN